MYQDKQTKRSGRSVALMVSLVLLFTVAVGGTIAFLVDSAGPLHNQFTPSQITTDVDEDIRNGMKTRVKIKNTGDVDAWIRAAVVVTWQDKDGNVYGQAPVAGTDYNAWDLGNDWKQGDDGFYYYSKPVVPHDETKHESGQCCTGVLIEAIKPLSKSPADGYYLTVEIIGSGIQSKPAHVFNTEWARSGLTVKDKDEEGKDLAPENWILIKQGGAGQ